MMRWLLIVGLIVSATAYGADSGAVKLPKGVVATVNGGGVDCDSLRKQENVQLPPECHTNKI